MWRTLGIYVPMSSFVFTESSNFAPDFERKNKKKVTKKELKRKSDYRLRRWTTDKVGGPDGQIDYVNYDNRFYPLLAPICAAP